MHVISRKKLRQFVAVHPRAKAPLDTWFHRARRASWLTFDEVKAESPQADRYRQFVIFDIGGNKYRLIAEINYRTQKLYIRHMLTHADYTRGDWKTE
jgi:mRNA interferase HigB